MEYLSRPQDRRRSTRLSVNCPVNYARFDTRENPSDQIPSRSIDLSSKGVRLKSGFRVELGQMLKITINLGDNLVTFKGKVVHVNPSVDEGFEMGISFEEMEDQNRIALTRFLIRRLQTEEI